jgi:hypothetical protein
MRITIIRNIDRYRDGGTLAVKCFGIFNEGGTRDMEICFDRRIQRDGSAKKGVWFGYPEKQGSIQITDDETIAYIKSRITQFIEHQKAMADDIINN